jgi:hypothetical protein
MEFVPFLNYCKNLKKKTRGVIQLSQYYGSLIVMCVALNCTSCLLYSIHVLLGIMVNNQKLFYYTYYKQYFM